MNDYLAFRKMIMPLFIKIFFWGGSIMVILLGIGMCYSWMTSPQPTIPRNLTPSPSSAHFFKHGELYTGLAYIFLGPLGIRIYCEFLILFFKMNETLTEIKHQLKKNEKQLGWPYS